MKSSYYSWAHLGMCSSIYNKHTRAPWLAMLALPAFQEIIILFLSTSWDVPKACMTSTLEYNRFALLALPSFYESLILFTCTSWDVLEHYAIYSISVAPLTLKCFKANVVCAIEVLPVILRCYRSPVWPSFFSTSNDDPNWFAITR